MSLLLSGFSQSTSERQIRNNLYLDFRDRIQWTGKTSCTIHLSDNSRLAGIQATIKDCGWQGKIAPVIDAPMGVTPITDTLADLIRDCTPSGDSMPIKVINAQLRAISYRLVCDDELIGGTKMRALVPLFRALLVSGRAGSTQITKVSYGSPSVGGAQVAIAAAAKTTTPPLQVVIYTNGRSAMTETAADLGAKIHNLGNVPQKMVNYAAAATATDAGTLCLPFGLGTPSFIELLAREIRQALHKAAMDLNPPRIWIVVGSGTVAKALARVFTKSTFCLVQVGKWLAEDDLCEIEGLTAGVEVFIAPEAFHQPAEIRPPYNSNLHYDAKLWRFFCKHGKNGDLIWNVSGGG